MNAFICRFLLNTVDAFTRYTFRPANVFVNKYILQTDCIANLTGAQYKLIIECNMLDNPLNILR